MSDSQPAKKDYGGLLAQGFLGFLLGFLVQFVLFVMYIIPLRVSQLFAIGIVKLIPIFLPSIRGLVRDNLRQVVGDSLSEAEMKKLMAKNMEYSWAHRYVDMLAVRKFDKAYFEKHITVEGLEKYQEAAALDKGVVLVSFHMGCPLVTFFCGVPNYGPPLFAAARRLFNDRASKALKDTLQSGGMCLEWSNFAYDRMIEHVKNKGAIVVMGDHMTSPRGIRVNYFGRDTLMPAGPAITAMRTGAPLIPVYGMRTSLNDVVIRFGDPIDVPTNVDSIKEEDLVNIANQYIPFFEKGVREFPHQWETFCPHWPKSFSKRDIYDFTTRFSVVSDPPTEDEEEGTD